MKREEVFSEVLNYFGGDLIAADVFLNKYCLKNNKGEFLEKSPDDMHRRLAKEFDRIEKKYNPNANYEEEFYEQMKNFKYIVPQGSPMFGIGNNYVYTSLSNCFVVGNEEDSYGGIFIIDQEIAQLQKRRGGVGVDLSHIRPEGSVVKNSAMTSTGVVSFMKRFSNTTLEVAQGGRRGALMLTISINHPDAEKFIDAKMKKGEITGANISIKVTDEFMRAVKENKEFKQTFFVKSNEETIEKTINAQELFRKIVHNAWASAEPGLLFWDTIIRESIPDCYSAFGFKTTSTNPCGEIPLCPYDSCRLISLNLYNFVENKFTEKAYINYEALKKSIFYITRMADDLIDLEIEKINSIINKIKNDPEDESTKEIEIKLWEKIREKAKQGRRVGIGITALGDMLAALNIKYGSEESLKLVDDLFRFIKRNVYYNSIKLAQERSNFLIFNFNLEKDNEFLLRIKEEDENKDKNYGLIIYENIKRFGRRNISLLTIPPTGTVSIMTQTTSGIEPAFMIYYKRKRRATEEEKIKYKTDTIEYNIFHKPFKDFLKIKFKLSDQEIETLSKEQIDEYYKQSPYYLSTSRDVNYVNKVKLQGIIQKHIDHSISVTINMPAEVTEDLVYQLYLEAWESGCKGITIYREGSREGVLVSDNAQQTTNAIQTTRPNIIEADVHRFMNNKEQWIAFVGKIKINENKYKPYEIFTGLETELKGNVPLKIKNGFIKKIKTPQGSTYQFIYKTNDNEQGIVNELEKSFNPELWNYSKLISAILRNSVDVNKVYKIVNSLKLDDSHINTWKNGILRILKKYIDSNTETGETCPICNSKMVFQEGCATCTNCGYSKCGS